jgi:hypothetical protein
MERVHSLTSIATALNRSRRTVQDWYTRAKSEADREIGELIDGTRYFSDDERVLLVKYAGTDRPIAKPATPSVTVESGNHQIVLNTPQLPQTYTLESLRKSEAVIIEDPLAVATRFMQVADQLVGAMQSDIQQREQRLNQTKQAKDAIATKTAELKLESRLYQERTQIIDSVQSQETQALQSALSLLQQMGKPQNLPDGLSG